jgi:serine/threonine protein kinase
MTALRKLVRYQLLSGEPLFQHGQGAIWKAEDLLHKRDTALKEIRADLREDPAAIESFRLEAAAGARLGSLSPNIVPVYDYGQVDGVFYFVMKWVEGGSLANRCGRTTLREAKSILRQVSRAVDVAHESGIVHSDIAPANILYDNVEDNYKLSDFGYLKIIDESLVSRGMNSMLIGGRAYFLPPEHRMIPQHINESTDVYALSLTLHALLTGTKLTIGEDGKLKVPGIVRVRQDNSVAPDEVRQLLYRFIEGRRDKDRIADFQAFLYRVP